MTRLMMTFGLRPAAAMPRYRRAGTLLAGTVRAKNESRRLGPGGGKTRVSARAKTAWTWSDALLAVAVEATILGLNSLPEEPVMQSPSIAVS